MEKRKFPSWVWFLVAAGLSLLVLAIGIVRVVMPNHDWLMLAAGCLGLVLCAIAFPIWQGICSSCPEPREQYLLPLTERLDQLAILLNLMSEQQLLSDRAISIAYREKDR